MTTKLKNDTDKVSFSSRLMNNFRTKLKWRRRAIWASSIATVLVLVLTCLPIVTARMATAWLQNNGASAARIENVDVNLFTGTVRLVGLEADGSAQQRLRIGLAELDMRWWPLARKHILVDALRLTDTQIDIATDKQGNWQIGGIHLSPAGDEPELTEATDDSGFDWGIGSDAIAIANVSITYRDSLFDTDIEIQEITIGSHSSWLAERSTAVVVDMAVNGAPILLNSDVAPWAQERTLSGAFNVSELALENYGQALQNLAGLENARGAVSLDLVVTASLDAQGVLEITVSGPLALTDIGFTRDVLAFSNQLVDWQGQVQVRLPATEIAPLLVADGAMQVTGTEVTLDTVSASNRLLDWQGQVSLAAAATGEASTLQATGSLRTEDTGAALPALGVASQSLDWEGAVVINLAPAARPLLSLDGALQVAGSSAELEALELKAGIEGIDLTANLEFTPADNSDAAPALALTSALSGQGLTLVHSRLPFDLARLENFSVSDARLSSIEQASLTQLQLQGLHLLAGNAAEGTTADVLELDQLLLTKAGFTAADGVSIESVVLNEPSITIVRDANGDIERLSALLAVYASKAEPTPDAASVEEDVTRPIAESAVTDATAAPLALAVTTLQATGQNLLDFEDLSVTPPVSFGLARLDLGVSNINSASSEPMSVLLTTGNENMQLDVEGTISAFAEELAVNLMATLSGLELPRFSAYVPGYNIETGRFSTESTLSIRGEALDLQNAVLIERLALSGKAAQGSAILGQGMAMPLDMALDMLRDGEDRIALALPVTGSLSDPSFDSTDIIRTVMQNAIQNAAMSYVTNMLQPLGTLLLVRDLASKAAAPRFAPLEMAAGEASLSQANHDYLSKIGDLLSQRPRLQLNLCGIATEVDREALTTIALAALVPGTAVPAVDSQADPDSEQAPAEPMPPTVSDAELLQLAARRTTVAIEYLTEEAMIAPDRLFSCRETIDEEGDAAPRVRIEL